MTTASKTTTLKTVTATTKYESGKNIAKHFNDNQLNNKIKQKFVLKISTAKNRSL